MIAKSLKRLRGQPEGTAWRRRPWSAGSPARLIATGLIPRPKPLIATVFRWGGSMRWHQVLEITYNTGPKVILQGPCMYDVESSRGGFLSLGKLTARVEKTRVRGVGAS